MGSTAITSKHGFFERILSWIYDSMIVEMTAVWYRAVLKRQKVGNTILDVGVGTAGALLRCKDIIIAKKLRIIGIDYNHFYINAAHKSIQEAGTIISKYVQVHQCDIYDRRQLESLLSDVGVGVNAVYFSGSFSLLPDPMEALTTAASILDDGEKISDKRVTNDKDKHTHSGEARDAAKIYITQTYQRHSPPFLSLIKPLIKYVTTIDFGRLVREEEVIGIFQQEGIANLLEVEEHGVLEGSVDNYWQAAYLSVLKPKTN